MHCSALSIHPSLSEQLRRRTDRLRSSIARSNYNTQFARTASELAEFRDATAGLIDGMDDDTLSSSFQKAIHFTTHDSYAPFIARFFEKPCRTNFVVNLLAPGLPDYLSKSTSTSGGRPKVFPKYECLSKMSSLGAHSHSVSDPPRTRTRAYLSRFGFDRISVEDQNSSPIKTVYVTGVSVVNRRSSLNLHPEEDEEKMATFILDHAAPYAAGFINEWHSYLLIHALFALSSRSLETMTISYTSTFVDLMRYLDTEFDLVVDCIASGTIPDLEGTAEVRHHLEVNFFSDPERAEELRNLGRPSSRPGWCSHAWPNLRSITTTASGSFATYLPMTRWFLGPNVDVHSRGYRSTEAVIASPYNPLELNQYKMDNESIFEFLDISKGDSIDSLVQLWEVEIGKRYEVVLTTQDGLWRYRLNDVVEIIGFDPTDGVPIIRFIERRNVAIRFTLFMVSEEELSAAILSMASNTLAQIVGWTATIDNRQVPSTIGFFVELAGDQGMSPFIVLLPWLMGTHFALDGPSTVSDLALAADYLVEKLSRSNDNLAGAVECGILRKPTIRVVQPGTFHEFLRLKLDEVGSNNISQLKVPVVLPKDECVAWFSSRVIKEV